MTPTTPTKVPFHKIPLVQKLTIPAIGLLVLFGLFLLTQNRGAAEEDVAAKAAEVATQQQLANLKAAGVIVTPTQPEAPKPQPDYDFLTCTHTVPEDPECVPFAPEPLTLEAQELIGWQGGKRGGALNRDNTRDIVDQIRRMPGVPTCDMYFGMQMRENGSLNRTVYANQATSTPGAVKLYDCTPKAQTPITAPTRGGA